MIEVGTRSGTLAPRPTSSERWLVAGTSALPRRTSVPCGKVFVYRVDHMKRERSETDVPTSLVDDCSLHEGAGGTATAVAAGARPVRRGG